MSQKKGSKGGIPATVRDERNPYNWRDESKKWIERKAMQESFLRPKPSPDSNYRGAIR